MNNKNRFFLVTKGGKMGHLQIGKQEMTSFRNYILEGAFYKKLNFFESCFPKYNFGKSTKLLLSEITKISDYHKFPLQPTFHTACKSRGYQIFFFFKHSSLERVEKSIESLLCQVCQFIIEISVKSELVHQS